MRRKMTISVSEDVHQAMRLRDQYTNTNWSQLATEAFRNYLIADPKIDDDMVCIITREQLRASKKRTDT